MTRDKPPKPQTPAERKAMDEARAVRFALAKRLFDEVRSLQPPDPYARPRLPAQDRLETPAIDLPAPAPSTPEAL